MQAIHACPQLGDVVVVVLLSGAVCLYRGGLESLAQCDPSREAPTAAAAGGAAVSEVLWSDVRKKRVLVLEKHGAEARISIFVLSASAKRSVDGGMPAIVSGTVTLASWHVLPKPSLEAGYTAGTMAGTATGVSLVDEKAEACSAAWLTGSDGVLSVAWRSPRGTVWTKVVVSTSGAREEFARPLEVARLAAAAVVPAGGADGGSLGAVAAVCNGQKSAKKPKSKKGAKGSPTNRLVEHASSNGSLACGGAKVRDQCLPALATADGGRLIVHSGGASPRLTVWDATYGVLLEDGESPEVTAAVAAAENPGAVTARKSASMVVSGDGAHLALALGGSVVVFPLPVKESGTLASLLRRKRPAAKVAATIAAGAAAADVFRISTQEAFPTVDLAGSSSAAHVLLQKTGVFADGEWEAAVVSPVREQESAVIQGLQDAAHRKDPDDFERVLREHVQRRAVAEGEREGGNPEHTAAASGAQTPEDVGKHDGGSGGGGKEVSTEVASSSRWEHGRSKRRRAIAKCLGYSAGVLSTAIELCISNPEANLWNALGLLVRSGGVSARNHRGLVAAIVKDGPQELLEEVRES